MIIQKNILKNFNQLLEMNLSDFITSQSGSSKEFKKGAIIYNAGETINNLLLVEGGDVKVVDYSNNNQYIKYFHNKGSLMDLNGFFNRTKYNDTAISMTKVKVRIWKKKEIESLSSFNPAFNAFLLQQILNNSLKLEQQLTARHTLTSNQRVIKLLLELIKEKGVKIGFEVLVRSTLTHQEMADYIDTARQTVTTVLNELKKQNLLVFDRRRILFRDVERLKALLYNSEIN